MLPRPGQPDATAALGLICGPVEPGEMCLDQRGEDTLPLSLASFYFLSAASQGRTGGRVHQQHLV